MFIKPKSNKKKIVIVGILAIVFVAASALAWYFLTQTGSKPSVRGVDYNPATEEQKQSGSDAKKAFTDKAYPSESTPPQPSPDSSKRSVDLSVTNHGPNEGVYQFRTLISTTSSGGTCKLTMASPGRQEITKTLGTQVVGTYSVCAGYFDIPLSELAGATWKVTIKYDNTQSEGSTALDIKAE